MRRFVNKSKISSDKQGFLIILSAPSGCGKTTILSRLVKRHPDWVRSVSVTTRPKRLEEKEGRDYEFVTARKFEALKQGKEFLEWARIFDHQYGTLRKGVEEGVQKGRIVILTVDIQGNRSIRRAVGKRVSALSIFILPPSISILRERLEKRSMDSAEEIEKRIQRAEEEIKAAREYDATVINHDLDQTTHEIETLVSEFEKKLTSFMSQGQGGKGNGLHSARKAHA